MFSKACEYALRATIYLAQKSGDRKISIDEIAEAIDSPRPFTAKILQTLNRAGVISSFKGPTGGFYMLDAATEKPVKAVLEAFGEDNIFYKCVIGLKGCSEQKPCPMHDQYKPVRQQLLQMFEQTSIRHLAEDTSNGLAFINNARLKGG